MSSTENQKHTIIVEHLDPELDEWQVLEYKCISDECSDANTKFVLSGLKSASKIQSQLQIPSENLSEKGVESIFPTETARRRVCLLDPKAAQDLSPEDGEEFDAFLFGGILGDDPPRDRTGELRKLGFPGRRLGKEQMTTDTAARVTRIVVQQKVRLEDIPYIDRPDINLTSKNGDAANGSESVSMPFRYVRNDDGTPVMPKLCRVVQYFSVDVGAN